MVGACTKIRPVVAGIGELLWDILPGGENLGGAPINFAYMIAAMGGVGIPVSTVGDDERGHRALAELAHTGLSVECISTITGPPTGTVDARIDDEGVASYSFPDDVAWDHLLINEPAHLLKKSLRAICFGTLAQRYAANRRTLRSYLDTLNPECIRVCDLNLRQHFYSKETLLFCLHCCTVLKINDEELEVLAKMMSLSGNTPEQLSRLISEFDLDMAALTRGGRGSIIMTRDCFASHPGYGATPVDTIGAGDSFTAAVVLGLLGGRELAEISSVANRLAAYVCTQSGAMVRIPPHYRYQ